ncbi:MAG TPA: hypothetical protein VIK78_22595 [Ruminiclostridium sp.]
MKKSILIMVLTVAMLVLAATTAYAESATLLPKEVSASDLENLNKELEKTLKGLDKLGDIDFNNLQETTVNTQKRIADVNTIETNMMIAAGNGYTLGLKTNGTVIATGMSMSGADKVSDWTNITMIACGLNHSVGLKSDGTVVATGSVGSGECNVSGWKDIKMIAAGLDCTIGLKKDGTVVATGSNEHDKLEVQAWKNIVAISSGSHFNVGLKSDGTVLAIGKDCSGILNVSSWRDIASVSASFDNILGLKKDGTVINTIRSNTSLFKNVTSVAASAGYAAGLKKDGTVITNSDIINTSTWKNIIAISAGATHLVGLKSDGTVVATDANDSWNMGQSNVKTWQLKVVKVAKVTATSTNSKITVNGKKFTMDGYTFDKNIYVKIRDLASVLKGTSKQFSVDGDGVKKPIKLVSNSAYKAIGGELKKGDGKPKEVTKTTSENYIDGKKMNFTIYKINGETYFKMRDVMQKFNIYVGWDAKANSITLDTKKAYKAQ